MHPQRPSARNEYRQQENQRVNASASLAAAFRDLKSLTVELAYFRRGSSIRDSEIRYTVNLANAKSLFRFSCENDQCVGGDFDLSEELARAVGTHQTELTGEVVCEGWRSETEIGQERCHNTLRYKLSAVYASGDTPA